MEARDTPRAPEGIRAARDLRVQEPRPFGLELEGYAHLPRMLDKARATLAGTAGTYRFGCPVDHTCMARLGVSPDVVLDLAGRWADDGRVLQALREHGIPPAAEAWFDAPAAEEELQADGFYLRVRRVEELPEHRDGRRFAGSEHGAPIDVVVVDVPPGRRGDPTVAAAPQVWVVQAGEATFVLGRRQARTVRAGNVVRVPAGVAWHFEVGGADAFRAVAVTAAASG